MNYSWCIHNPWYSDHPTIHHSIIVFLGTAGQTTMTKCSHNSMTGKIFCNNVRHFHLVFFLRNACSFRNQALSPHYFREQIVLLASEVLFSRFSLTYPKQNNLLIFFFSLLSLVIYMCVLQITECVLLLALTLLR